MEVLFWAWDSDKHVHVPIYAEPEPSEEEDLGEQSILNLFNDVGGDRTPCLLCFEETGTAPTFPKAGLTAHIGPVHREVARRADSLSCSICCNQFRNIPDLESHKKLLAGISGH